MYCRPRISKEILYGFLAVGPCCKIDVYESLPGGGFHCSFDRNLSSRSVMNMVHTQIGCGTGPHGLRIGIDYCGGCVPGLSWLSSH